MNEYSNSLFKSKKQDDIDLRMKLEEDNTQLVKKLLKLYLDRCIFMHSLAFF